MYGADIKSFGGIERLYSHNGGDPLHRDNLPSWCTVAAVDVVDVVVILDYGGDRDRALHDLAKRYSINKREERRALARLLFQLIRRQASQEDIEDAAYAEGERLGLTPRQIVEVACWVVDAVTTGGDA
jgi:hypothetical protein